MMLTSGAFDRRSSARVAIRADVAACYLTNPVKQFVRRGEPHSAESSALTCRILPPVIWPDIGVRHKWSIQEDPSAAATSCLAQANDTIGSRSHISNRLRIYKH